MSQIEDVVNDIRIVKSLDVASGALLIYDYLITLDMEVQYMWSQKRWSPLRALFFFTRYNALVDVPISLFGQFIGGLDERSCSLLFKYFAWSFVISSSLAEAILTIRTWAVWKGSPIVTIGLSTFFIACWVTSAVFLSKFLATTYVLQLPIPQVTGCFSVPSGRTLSVIYALYMVYGAGTMVLMIISAFVTQRTGPGSSLMYIFYRDGISYYIYLFLLSTMNLISIVSLPNAFANLLTTLMRVLYASLACRSVLHLRQQSAMQTLMLGGGDPSLHEPEPSGLRFQALATQSVSYI
ncbi:hypothetical protein ONZ45_g9153 [Pleurotus djamor]|nr:hypothetical protein ONZ45_g9153 [Pleurotus djamor]